MVVLQKKNLQKVPMPREHFRRVISKLAVVLQSPLILYSTLPTSVLPIYTLQLDKPYCVPQRVCIHHIFSDIDSCTAPVKQYTYQIWLNCLGIPLNVEIFYPYWQETLNFIFWVPSIENLLVAKKLKKIESKSIFHG